MQVEIQHYEFHSDAKEYESESKPAELDNCIRKVIKNEGYLTCDVTKKAIAADGGNYLGVLYEVDVKGKTEDGNKETAIFVKSMAPESTLEVISIPDVYKTEIFVYKEIINLYNELQNEANVPAYERYNTVKCYDAPTDAAIIMENITRKGFKTYYRMDIVTLEMAEICIKQLAKFHGLSFITEQRRPDFFNAKIKCLKTAYIFGESWTKFLETFPARIVGEWLDLDLRSKIERVSPDLFNKMAEYHTDDSLKYCLCHGDYRPNNIMIKEVNGKVAEVIPVDYQLVYYGCPMIDFFFFMYLSTDRQFRKLYMVHLKNLYYNSLEQFLQYFDITAESVLPRKAFEKLYEDTMDYGLIISFLVCPFLFISEDEDIPDVSKVDIVEFDFKFDARFKKRLTDAVEEFIESGYL